MSSGLAIVNEAGTYPNLLVCMNNATILSLAVSLSVVVLRIFFDGEAQVILSKKDDRS